MKINFISSIRKLSSVVESNGMEFRKVINVLKSIAPLSLAESWDNVGVLIEPPKIKQVSKILLTNDLTLDVMDEAENYKVNLILSYHPPIFRPLKSITSANWKENIIGRCLSNGIAVYSPHTSYDSVEGGINDWLLEAFGPGDVTTIQPHAGSPKLTHKVEIICQGSDGLKDLHSSLTREFTEGTLIQDPGEGCIISVFVHEGHLGNLVSFLSSSANSSTFAVSKLEKVPMEKTGAGRKIALHRPLTLSAAVDNIKMHLKLKNVRLAVKHKGSLNNPIYSVAVCAGSGISVLRGVKADLLLTGEMSHHEVLDMTQRGLNVVLTEHSNCERGYLSAVLQDKLTTALNSRVKVIVSEADKDPLEVV